MAGGQTRETAGLAAIWPITPIYAQIPKNSFDKPQKRDIAHMTERTTVKGHRMVPEPDVKNGTPQNGCVCEGCVFLRTQIGNAMMNWSLEFAKRCRSAVELGLKKGTILSINMNGPDAEALVRKDSFNKGVSYTNFHFDPAAILDEHASGLLKGPNTEVLRELYGDDPVLSPLIDWLEKRYGQ
jgi:hypothetical protein